MPALLAPSGGVALSLLTSAAAEVLRSRHTHTHTLKAKQSNATQRENLRACICHGKPRWSSFPVSHPCCHAQAGSAWHCSREAYSTAYQMTGAASVMVPLPHSSAATVCRMQTETGRAIAPLLPLCQVQFYLNTLGLVLCASACAPYACMRPQPCDDHYHSESV